MKFKVGDSIIYTSVEESNGNVFVMPGDMGKVTNVNGLSGRIKCRWNAFRTQNWNEWWCWEDKCVTEEVYNSPLFQAMQELDSDSDLC